HHDQHHRGQRVDAQRPGNLKGARIDPGGDRNNEHLLVTEADGHEHQDRQCGRDQQSGAGDDLRWPVADHTAKQPGDRRSEQRQQDDELDGKIHGSSLPQPFIALMSSTSTVPRLRKYTTRIASPIAASAAATVSTSMANTWPVTLPW